MGLPQQTGYFFPTAIPQQHPQRFMGQPQAFRPGMQPRWAQPRGMNPNMMMGQPQMRGNKNPRMMGIARPMGPAPMMAPMTARPALPPNAGMRPNFKYTAGKSRQTSSQLFNPLIITIFKSAVVHRNVQIWNIFLGVRNVTGAPVMPAQAAVPMQPQQQPQAAVFIQGQEPLTASMLAQAPPSEQKQMLGERLFPLIQGLFPDLAGKITGMLLEIDNSDLVHMLEDKTSLSAKVEEAVAVLNAHKTTPEN